MTGSGNSGSWTGALACPGFLAVCGLSPGQLVTTLTTASITLSSDNLSLTILGSGTATCGGNPTTFTFSYFGT